MGDNYSGSDRERYDRSNAAGTSDRIATDTAVADRQEAARRALTKNDKGANAAPTGEPQAKDYGSLGEFAAAKAAWRKNQGSPQKQAISGMLAAKQQ